jgi:hypothetical protein
MGGSLGSDGRLLLDTQKFDLAQKTDPSDVRSTLTQLGKRAHQTAGLEMDSSGNVGIALSSLNQRTSILKSQKNTLASLSQQG